MEALAPTPIRSGSIDGGARSAASAASAASARDDELDAAAKSFEKLMVQRLLSEARKTRFGDEPSNAQSNYDAMFDYASTTSTLMSDIAKLAFAPITERTKATYETIRKAA